MLLIETLTNPVKRFACNENVSLVRRYKNKEREKNLTAKNTTMPLRLMALNIAGAVSTSPPGVGVDVFEDDAHM